MTTIRDPVHGYVKLDEVAMDLVDTRDMQRLRWVKQLGLANLVYPGANHTRFEHSLGAYHLSGLLARHLEVSEEEALEIQAAALLHDVGHGPFSHATEKVLSAFLREEHEKVADRLKRGELGDALRDHGIRPHRIQMLIRGEAHLGQVVSGEVDVDRMDYLTRDAHYTGVAYGVIDHQRLMDTMVIRDGQLALEEGGVHAAESLLVSRLLMYPTVYFHHVSRIAQEMLGSGVRAMVEEGADPRKIRDMDDLELSAAMTGAEGYPGEIMGRIRMRRLFKRAVYVGRDLLESPGIVDRGREDRIAEEIADQAGIDPRYVLVDKPALPRIAEGNVSIAGRDGEKRPLREVSPLVTIMESAHLAAWRLGVYTTEENRERVKRAAMSHLQIGTCPVQHTLEDL
ncbi:HD domain-containing protein [Methanotrichaceae archaeon M04Ac]|uniref:HD domain-containing protein n=1 Tax=Candidatus Methanocrinis alkalitolerans TaxID=3033395 RepID=A0ABT5XH63_9EURY|nr:HD domain-containing protein [Candidatus Methanocrinis alkalitolerans]MCR3882974.1 HD domain-containing protein [Methanothrix sp.]MDF0593976.1 HD domain-containing protein [Candidatus Methanocrinis alkalitolerans]